MKSKNKKVIEKIINIILNILIVIVGIVFLISLYTGFQIKVLKNSYANFFGYSMFEVQTGSMADTINAGDWIIVKLTQDVKLNDVITYKYKNEYITHRVIEAYKSTFVTKGDANNSKDAPIDKSQIIGKVVKIMPSLGILKKTIFEPVVLLALLITFLIFNLVFGKKNEKITNIFCKIMSKSKNKKVTKNEDLENTRSINICDVESVNNKDLVENTVSYKVVNAEENNSQKAEDASEIMNKIEEKDPEDEMENTFFFRSIEVDMDDANNTLLELARNEKESKLKEKSKVKDIAGKKKESSEKDDIDSSKTINASRKPKNVIDNIIILKENQLDNLIYTINFQQKLEVNEPRIKSLFIKFYMDCRYYNLYLDENEKLTLTKIKKTIKELGTNLINEYKGNDKKYKDKVNKFIGIFNVILDIENNLDASGKKSIYIDILNKHLNGVNIKTIEKIASKIISIQKEYDDKLKYILKKLDTNVFELELSKINSYKNMQGIRLNHNVSFSKVYSDYIIDKTYNEGKIAEDRIIVLLTLLSRQLITDMMDLNSNKKYLIYIPESLYSKKKKLDTILSMIDNEYAKKNVIILLKKHNLINNELLIGKYKKDGYRFALSIDNIDFEVAQYIYIPNYIFVIKDEVNKKDLAKMIPKDIVDQINYEDINDKVENFGSD